MKTLLIEDEAVLAQDIIDYLTNEQYLCEQAQDYQAAIRGLLQKFLVFSENSLEGIQF